MTLEEADKIFKGWQEYAEINDKLQQLFGFSSCAIPESFLPYPRKILEEALNIIAKKHFDAKDYKTSALIQEQGFGSLIFYENDEIAIEKIVDGWTLKDPELRKISLSNLKKSQDSWERLKTQKGDV